MAKKYTRSLVKYTGKWVTKSQNLLICNLYEKINLETFAVPFISKLP